MSDLEAFRAETRAWLEQNCPPSRRRPKEGEVAPAWGSPEENEQVERWRELVVERGWTGPTWPVEYGGAGLSVEEEEVLAQEMRRIRAVPPIGGFGMYLLAPVLLEFGNHEQKLRFLPDIASGRLTWQRMLQTTFKMRLMICESKLSFWASRGSMHKCKS